MLMQATKRFDRKIPGTHKFEPIRVGQQFEADEATARTYQNAGMAKPVAPEYQDKRAPAHATRPAPAATTLPAPRPNARPAPAQAPARRTAKLSAAERAEDGRPLSRAAGGVLTSSASPADQASPQTTANESEPGKRKGKKKALLDA
jgi:hypothetical protein